jgi:hypothetical protein
LALHIAQCVWNFAVWSVHLSATAHSFLHQNMHCRSVLDAVMCLPTAGILQQECMYLHYKSFCFCLEKSWLYSETRQRSCVESVMKRAHTLSFDTKLSDATTTDIELMGSRAIQIEKKCVGFYWELNCHDSACVQLVCWNSCHFTHFAVVKRTNDTCVLCSIYLIITSWMPVLYFITAHIHCCYCDSGKAEQKFLYNTSLFTYFLGYKTYAQNIRSSENILQAHCAHFSERAAGLAWKVGRLLMNVVFVQHLMNLPFNCKFQRIVLKGC